MILSYLGKNERIVDGKGRAVTFGQAQDLVRILTGLPERTPEALWLAVDDHWRQKFILTDNIMQPITSAQLLEVALQYESQIQQIAEKASQAASVQEAQHYQDQMQQIGEKLSTFASAQIYTQQYEIRDKLLQAAKAQAQEPTNLLTGVDWGKLVTPSTAFWPSSASVSQALVSLTAPAMQKFLEQNNAGMQQIAEKMAQGAKFIVEQQIINLGQSALHALVALDSKAHFHQAFLPWGDQSKYDLSTLASQVSGVKLWELPAINFATLGLFEGIGKQAFAAALTEITELARYGISSFAWIEQERRMQEACAILEIESDTSDEYYDNMDIRQFWSEVAVVQWMKETAQQGRLQSPAATTQLQDLLRTGKISGYTLFRFKHLLLRQPPVHGELHVSLSGVYVEIEPAPSQPISQQFAYLPRQRKKPPELFQRILYRFILWIYNNAGSWEKAYESVVAHALRLTTPSAPFEFKTFENNKGWAIDDEEIARMGITLEKLWEMYLHGELRDFLIKIGGKSGGNQGLFKGRYQSH